ncbi:MAG: hypothetical protein HOC23_15620 [Halieaceae bacterium]|nr:hypothetical protein [Halieaceae bacterium]
MMQKRAQSETEFKTGFQGVTGENFIESLYAIANADGNISADEVTEIKAIAAEFGITDTGTRDRPVSEN